MKTLKHLVDAITPTLSRYFIETVHDYQVAVGHFGVSRSP